MYRIAVKKRKSELNSDSGNFFREMKDFIIKNSVQLRTYSDGSGIALYESTQIHAMR